MRPPPRQVQVAVLVLLAGPVLLTLAGFAWLGRDSRAQVAATGPGQEATSPPSGQFAQDDGPDGQAAVRRVLFASVFENATGQEEYAPAAAAMGDLLAVLLAEQDHIAVVERQQLLSLTAEQARALKGLTAVESAVRAGRMLRADSVLIGRVYLAGDRLLVNAQVIDIADERVIAAAGGDCQAEDLIATATQLARDLSRRMALPLPPMEADRVERRPNAALCFARAMGFYHGGNMDAALLQLMQTLDLDPDCVEAHYWAGLAYQRLGEADHAVVEWETYLERLPQGPQAGRVRAWLKQSRESVPDTAVRWRNLPSTQPDEGP